jgi:hypothetical protein
MNKLLRCSLLAAVLVSAASASAAAGELKLTIANGRVTLIAEDVTVRQILAEWARIGQTRIENGDKMMGPPLTLELRDVPEAQALETILRSAAGYVVAPRMAGSVGASAFDRILILPTSRPPVVTASAPPAFNPPRPIPQPIMPQLDDTDVQPGNPMPTSVQGQPYPGMSPQPGAQPGMQPGQMPPQVPQGPLTAPRPGPLPQQPVVPGNPYQPQPGVRPPGTPGGPGGVPQPGRPGGGGS